MSKFVLMSLALAASAAHADTVADTKTMPKISVEAVEPDAYRAPESRTRDQDGHAAARRAAVGQRGDARPDPGPVDAEPRRRRALRAGRRHGAGRGQPRHDHPARQQLDRDFFLDGVRDDVEYFRDLYNIDRVEVLKGPNAMIFGRGGAGGVVNRVTRQANWEPVREVSLQGGSWDNRRATFDVGDAVNDESRCASPACTRTPRATATASSSSAMASTRRWPSGSATRRCCGSPTSTTTTTASPTAAFRRSNGRPYEADRRRRSSATRTRARPTRR